MKTLPLLRRAAALCLHTLALGAPLAVHAQVGMARLDLPNLPVTLVYPTEAAATRQTLGPFEIEVATGAVPAPGAPRRLVVMSHGTGGSALAAHTLAATLARAGFVVAQPLHAGDNHTDTSKAGPDAWQTRPIEVSRVIDALAAHPQWAPRLALDRVGVHGMSAGGVTALSLAGAQWSVLDLVRHCNAHLDEDIGFCLNGALEPEKQAARKARYANARGVPDFFLPAELKQLHGGRTPPADSRGFDPRPDPRVAAVTLEVPVAAPFTAASLARIQVPVGVVVATGDLVLVPRFHSSHLLQHCKSCTTLAELPGAGHFDVLHPWPQVVADAVEREQVRGGRPTPGFDAGQRSAAFARIAEFQRRQLDAPAPR